MCGFGLVLCKRDKIDYELIRIAEDDLGLRGPSSATHYLSEQVYMYQSVLAIQTEPKHEKSIANLPINYKVTLYNGEIYDETKYSNDTDYIKKEELEKILLNCDGMFSVANVEKHGSYFNVDVYRDVIGEKRCFYYDSPRLFIISSTPSFIKDVLEKYGVPIRVNKVALKDYFLTRHYISNSTSIEGIYQVPPGHKLTYNKHLTVERVWSGRDYLNTDLIFELKNKSHHDYTLQVNELLLKTLQKMQKSVLPHVKVYSVVSGGVDSSIVTHFLEQAGVNVERAITLTFNQKDPVALSSNRLFKNLSSLQLQRNIDIDEYYESYLECLKLCCSPIPSHDFASANIMFSMVEPGSILYGGEGADELFLGYKYYESSNKSQYTLPIRNNFILSFEKEIEEDFNYVKDFFRNHGFSERDSSIKACSYVDFFHQMPNATLMSTDLIGSSHGIECRTPFTRKDIVTFALNSPVSLLLGKSSLVKLFETCFNTVPFEKRGFCGHPNEMLRYLPNGLCKSYSTFGMDRFESSDRDIAWKYINTEFFLNNVAG